MEFRTFASQTKIQGNMKFTINGREYEDYQLSNEQIVKLIEGDTLMGSEKSYLMEKAYERFKYDLCPKGGETNDDVFARFFGNYVNRCPNDFKKAAKTMGREHRYLQSEMFKMCIEYIKVLAEHYNNGCYDPRNEWACSTAYSIINEFNNL
jgi:hypothetical protein